MKDNVEQKIPNNFIEREILRQSGQFWTPDWIAESMVTYAIKDNPKELFDPAVGGGSFFRACKKICSDKSLNIQLCGYEKDENTLKEAQISGLKNEDLANIHIGDFVLDPPKKVFEAIVANPPYIRHHRLSTETKNKLSNFVKNLLGEKIDGRAGFHVYFFLMALTILKHEGRLAFILPADICEGKFSKKIWDWISTNFCLDAVITFSESAAPFPKLDTNVIIFLIQRKEPKKEFFWVDCKTGKNNALTQWINSDFRDPCDDSLIVFKRKLSEGLRTGLSRSPQNEVNNNLTLGEFARVMRGIATGANDFFLLSHSDAKKARIDKEFLLPVICRTRDISGDEITTDTLKELDHNNRPTLLLSLDGRDIKDFPMAIQEYLKQGEMKGLSQKALIKTRNPWYKMEKRNPPPFLFAYLGRRNARFIRNYTDAVPLTSFLCIYPHKNDIDSIEKLWKILQDPETIKNLRLVGKSYGSGAIKVEPRSLERLPLNIKKIDMQKYSII